MDFHRFPVYFIRFHGFQGQKVGGLWRRCGGLWQPRPGPNKEVSKLGGSNIRVLEARGFAGFAGLAGLAGRRMEQRSLTRLMLEEIGGSKEIAGGTLMNSTVVRTFKLSQEMVEGLIHNS